MAALGTQGVKRVVNLYEMLLEAVARIQSTLLIHHLDKRYDVLYACIVKTAAIANTVMQEVCKQLLDVRTAELIVFKRAGLGLNIALVGIFKVVFKMHALLLLEHNLRRLGELCNIFLLILRAYFTGKVGCVVDHSIRRSRILAQYDLRHEKILLCIKADTPCKKNVLCI